MQEPTKDDEPTALRPAASFTTDSTAPWNQPQSYAPSSDLAEALRELRGHGLTVAVHNDYRLNGEFHTFWLFTTPDGHALKGEGKTDIEALEQVRRACAALSAHATPISPERDALERIALLDEADGHGLTERHAFQAVAIATSTLGKHPSEITAERFARAALSAHAGAPRYRHKKRRSTYTKIGEAELQSATQMFISEGERLTIYRADIDGSLWARPTCEFEDGRFETLVEDAASPSPISPEKS